MNLHGVVHSWARALIAQFHYRILLLSLMPFFVSLILWGLVMWWGMQGLIDYVQAFFIKHEAYTTAGNFLSTLGLLAVKTMIVPLIAMWVLLPLMLITSLLAIGLIAMPVINRYVSARHYPALEQRKGGSFFGSVWHSLSSFVIFLGLWLLSLPLVFIPPVYFIVQPLLWGWLTYRVMAYDALADHADADERKSLTHLHRKPLLIIGLITGMLGAAPTMLWLGGAMSVALFPIFAGLAIWLYVLVFIFTGLWFQYYCLAALHAHRNTALSAEL